MISSDYGLYLTIGIGLIWIIGVASLIIDMMLKPRQNTIIKRTKQVTYSQTYNSKKEDDSFVIIDDVSFPI